MYVFIYLFIYLFLFYYYYYYYFFFLRRFQVTDDLSWSPALFWNFKNFPKRPKGA